MNTLEPGSTISHYEVKRLIARGGMGEVYKAVDTRLGRPVALKVLSPDLAGDERARRRLMREARAGSLLSHPNICTVFEIGETSDFLFIVMQYLEGKTIEDLLFDQNLPVEKAVSYAINVADALEEAHKNGVVHRDIKPSNVVVNDRDEAVVLDFGLAKQFFHLRIGEDNPTLLQVTTGSTVMGTVAYMSPEQVRAEEVDARSDVFSFGVLLYEMLTGVRPFNGPGKIDLLHAVLHDQPPPPGTANVDVDAELEHIVLKALSKKPGDRYQTMHDMRADLIRFANKRGYAVKGVTTSAHTPVQRASSSVSLNRKPGLVALLLIVVAGLGWLLYRSGHSSLASTPGAGPRVPLAKWKMSPSDDIDLRPRFSPDGTMIVFASARNGQVNIWGKQIAGGGEPFQITYDRWADSNPIWSYDGQRIAFISDRGEGPGIFTCPALGHGTPKKLKSLEGNHRALIRWSKDSIYYELDFNLFKLDVATEQTTRVTDFVLSGLPEFAVSPQEDRFAFINRKGEVLDLWVMPMTGGNAIQLTNDPAEESNLAWDATGKRIFYTAKKNGIYQVFAAYVNGDTHSQVTFGDSDSVLSDVSLDGSLLVVSSSEESDLYCVRSDGRDETALTTDIGVEFWPDAARDETTIAFQAIRNSAEGSSVTRSLIVSRQAEAGAQETELASDGFEPKWSPDGSRLAFLRSSGLPGRADIWCVGQSGGNERRLTTAGLQPSRFTVLPLNRAYVSDYSWSPDGSRIAYCSDKSGLWNVWAVSADGSGETMFSRSADRDVTLGSPLWSHRGDQLACVSKSDSGNGRRLSSVWLSGFDPKLLIQTGAQLRLLGWSADDRGVFVALAEGRTSAPGAVTVIWVPVKEDLKDKNTRIVARLDAAYFSNIHLSNSGDRIAFVSGQGGKDNVWVVPATNGSPRRVTQNQEPRMYISSLAWTPRDNMIVYGKQAKYAVISMIDRLN